MSQAEWLRDQKVKLYQSEDWRQFIELYWSVLKRQPAKINYAELSRKAKYSSRAHLFEVLKGKKKVSHSLISKLADALKLKAHEKQLFLLLAKKEPSTSESQKEILESVANLKNKLVLQNQILNSSKSISEVFSGKQVLSRFMNVKCVLLNQDRYHLTNVSLDLKDLGSNIHFKETFIKAVDEIKTRARLMEKFENDFYFHTAIPFRKGTQQAFKQRLRECILEFVDGNDEGSCDEIVHINLSAYRH